MIPNLALPLLIPFATAVACLLAWRRPAAQRWMALAGSAALLVAASGILADVHARGVRVLQVGGWPAPFAVPLVADTFSALMLVLTGLMALLVVGYSWGSVDADREAFGYYPVLQLLLMGVCGTFLTGDLFNLFVWFEVMLIASFVLLALGGERAQIEGAIKYVALNLLASLLFLTGIGLVYGLAGTLNLAELGPRLAEAGPGLTTTAAMLFFVAFGIKAAVFPLFFWLPAAYPTPPVVVSALFGGLLTKVGVYAMIRLFTLVFVHDTAFTHGLIMVVAGLTMVSGVLGAVVQSEIRRLLSFHVISQIGYLLMGLGLYTHLALLGAVFFMVHIVLAKAALFLVGGIVQRVRATSELDRLGGLAAERPGLAMLFLLPALSMAGIPPLSGFVAKLALVQAGLDARAYILVAVAVLVSLLTLYSMIKIWTLAFWGVRPEADDAAAGGVPPPGDRLRAVRSGAAPGVDRVGPARTGSGEASRAGPRPAPLSLVVPTAAMAALMVVLGFGAQPLVILAGEAAAGLMDPAAYVLAVLGTVP